MKNEAWLKERYEALTPAERPHYSLISVKLKRFRTINQRFGWAVGDELIRSVYQILAAQLGPGEYLAQIHLACFNLLARLPSDYDDLFHRIIQINTAIRDMPDERFFGNIFTGFGIYPLPAEPVDFYTAQYRADVARFECPESKFRNSHFEIYGVTLHDDGLRSFDLLQTLQPALDAGHIQLYRQPKVELATGRIAGAEALVRWLDPQRGMIPLAEFMPQLEKNGLIETLDLYMFEQVCKRLCHWQRTYGKTLKISVNLSGEMFNYRYYFKDYKRIHGQYPAPKECIEFELLESIVLNQVDRVREVTQELEEYGFSYSLDDFGSGYSSFSVLTNTRFSALKIDRSLFQDECNFRERVLVRHIVQMAHELGIATVAEGVETRDYVEYLKRLGCEYIQGFVFYRPMPADEFERRFLLGGETAPV